MNGAEIKNERAKIYGSPKARFATVHELFKTFEKFRDTQPQLDMESELAFRHAIYLELDKITRLAVTPEHKDSWVDLQGYAECGKECVG